jgi:hypothetical protein
MPIDPSIPLGVQVARPPDPMNSYAQMLQVKGLQQEQAIRDQQLQEGQQKIDAGKQAADDVAALNDAVRKHTTTADDGTTKVDHSGVVRDLAASGRGRMVLKYRDDVSKLTEQEWKTHQEQLKATKDLGETIAREFQGATDQQSWDAAKARVRPMVEKVAPEMLPQLEALGTYDPDKKARLVSIGMNAKDYADLARNVAEDARKKPGEDAKTLREQLATEGQVLGAATDQASWTSALQQLPEDRRAKYPAQFSGAARDLARMRGQSAEQQATDGVRKGEIAVAEGNLKARQAENDRLAKQPAATDPMLNADWREYQEAVNQHRFEHEQAWNAYKAEVQANEDRAVAKQTHPTPPEYKAYQSFTDWRQSVKGRTAPATSDTTVVIKDPITGRSFRFPDQTKADAFLQARRTK